MSARSSFDVRAAMVCYAASALIAFVALVIADVELWASWADPLAYATVLGAEGPAAGHCAYRDMHHYQWAQILQAGIALLGLLGLAAFWRAGRGSSWAIAWSAPVLFASPIFESACAVLFP